MMRIVRRRNGVADDAAFRDRDGVVGRFRAGYRTHSGEVRVCDQWRVTTAWPDVADAVHDILGGETPAPWDARGTDRLEVFTATAEVNVVLDGPDALLQRLILWGPDGTPVQDEDGDYSLNKLSRADGIKPEPDMLARFKLCEAPELGDFVFRSASWHLAIQMVREGVDKVIASGGSVRARLSLEPVSFIARGGPMSGKVVSYTQSALHLLGD